MNEPTAAIRVFICYAREDQEVAKQLYNDLKRAGVTPWIDCKDLLPGQNWKKTIEKVIKESSYFLALLSYNSVSRKGFVQRELREALELLEQLPPTKIFVIPVRLEECEPADERLQDIHRVDLFPSYKAGLNQILRALQVPIPENNYKQESTSEQPQEVEKAPPQHPSWTEEACKSRREHVQSCQEYVQKQEISSARESLQAAIDENKVLSPAVLLPQLQLPADSHFVDCICSVVKKDGRTIAIFPSPDSTPDIEGAGRTSLLLRLLGITIPYGRFIGLAVSAFHSLTGRIMFYDPTEYRLIATDVAYIGNLKGELRIVPTGGEYFSFAWDLARHIYRSAKVNYKTGDHRTEEGHKVLRDILPHIPLSTVINPDIHVNLFGKLDMLYPIEEIIILRREIWEHPRPPRRLEITGDKRRESLCEAILLTSREEEDRSSSKKEHHSPFWDRKRCELKENVDYILERLDWEKMCPIVEITLFHPNQRIPYYTFDEFAELVRKRKLPKKPDTTLKIQVGHGIRYHHDVLFEELRQVEKIKMLLTSGEKLFREAAFWELLFQAHEGFELQVLFLDPDSPAVEEREQAAYRDKYEAGFLRKEIQASIGVIRRITADFKQQKKQIHIECKLYQELPPFRMTFIGAHRLLVASYVQGERTGRGTIFYNLTQENELFHGFKALYKRIESTAKLI